MLHNEASAVAVDPGDAGVVSDFLQSSGLHLEAILVTHRHADHTLGLPALQRQYPGVPVYGPSQETIEGVTHPVSEGSLIEVAGLRWHVWDTPGHTSGHITYLADPQAGLPCPSGLVFCGDTLFSAGCGRLFDGTHEQLAQSLLRLSQLPEDTWLCPTHEYTLTNLEFAAAVEPDNTDIQSSRQDCAQLRDRLTPTLPTTVGKELRINPFLRTRHPQVLAQARAKGAANDTHVAVFTALRLWKNRFPS